jgi:adenylate cyclase
VIALPDLSQSTTSFFVSGCRSEGADALAAITLDPTFTPAYIHLAQIETHRGEQEAALAWTRQAMRISPREPRIGSALYAEAHAHTLLGNDEEAVSLSRRAIGAGFKAQFPYTYWAAGLANFGRTEEARGVAAELRVGNVERFCWLWAGER